MKTTEEQQTAEELLNLLLDKSEFEIEQTLLALLIKKKVNFITLSNLYVKYIERISKVSLHKEAYASGIVCNMMQNIPSKTLAEMGQTKTQALFLLNKSDMFNMEDMNEENGFSMEDVIMEDVVPPLYQHLFKH